MKFILIILFVIFLLFFKKKRVEKFSKKNNKCPKHYKLVNKFDKNDYVDKRNTYRCIPNNYYDLILNDNLITNKYIKCNDKDMNYNCHTLEGLLKRDNGDFSNIAIGLRKICDNNKCRKLNEDEEKIAIKSCKDDIKYTFGVENIGRLKDDKF